jgi:hypothetical protein
MLKGLVASALLFGLAAPALAKPPFDYHREARPQYDRGFERQQWRHDSGGRDTQRPIPFSRLSPDQKEALCAQTGVCIRAFKSDDVEDKSK